MLGLTNLVGGGYNFFLYLFRGPFEKRMGITGLELKLNWAVFVQKWFPSYFITPSLKFWNEASVLKTFLE